MNIAILTASYNREKLLTRLYYTIQKQTDHDFTWIIVDDGSTDNTESQVEKWKLQGNQFKLRYFKKRNGGKISAINYAFKNCTDIDFFAVIDSDEQLLTTAVSVFRKKALEYEHDTSVGGIYFRFYGVDGTLLNNRNNSYPTEEIRCNIYNYANKYRMVDGCLSYYKRSIQKYQYPEFECENYLSPSVLCMLMARDYSMIFTKEVVAVAEYQASGLTKSGRALRIKNPYGMIYAAWLHQSKLEPSYFVRLKYAIAAQAYTYIGRISRKDLQNQGIDPCCLKLWAKMPGALLGHYWLRKYGTTR